MGVPRAIALSADKTIATQIATALEAAGGAVEQYATVAELESANLDAGLVVLDLDGELAAAATAVLARLSGETRAIAVLPRSNLASIVAVMQASERLAALLVAEQLDTRELSALARRLTAGDIFGLDKIAQWGSPVNVQRVSNYRDKLSCIEQVSAFAETMRVRRKYREAIEQCLDEMLMNGLYDAPVDDHGKPLFPDTASRANASLPPEKKLVVEYACDGHRFAVGVRDAFGTLERSTVLRYLHKCLHSEQQIDRKAGGAGLGLFFMASSASALCFNVLPGVATEAICVFDLDAPKLQLRQLGFFTGHHEAKRAEATPSGRRRLIVALSVAIGVMFVLIAIAAWQRFQ